MTPSETPLDSVIDKLTICVKGLKAIQARISGVWDDPALEAFGPLSSDTVKDVLTIAEQALREAKEG